MATRMLHVNLKPNLKYFRKDNATHVIKKGRHLSHTTFLAAAKYHNLLTFKNVINLDHAKDWQSVCQYEMDALAKNGT